MEVRPKVIVKVPEPLDGRFKYWRKVLSGVDITKTNGYAFQGEWVTAGRKVEVTVGSYLLAYDEVGSRKCHYPVVRLMQVTPEGGLVQVKDEKGEVVAEGLSWALDLRDRIAYILAKSDSSLSLSADEEELVRHLASLPSDRRRLVVALAEEKAREAQKVLETLK